MSRQHLLFSLFCIFSFLTTRAQERDSVVHAGSRPQEQQAPDMKPRRSALARFFDFGNQDTLYISPNRYNYALMAAHFSNFEYYSIRSSRPQAQKLSFSPNPHNKVGLYFGWRWLFLGWSVDVDDLSRNTRQRNKGTELDLSLYSSKLGIDLFYRRTGNSYKIQPKRGFDMSKIPQHPAPFEGLKVYLKGLNLYYIFNNRHFSYPAAFSQSTNQRRSVGSFIAGFSLSKHHLEFDYAPLPASIRAQMSPEIKVNKIRYTNANLNFGYAYNWVFARNCLACLSLTPAIAYKTSDVNSEGEAERERYGKLNLDFLVRAGVVYNNGKFFVGSSFLGKNYSYRRESFSIDNSFGTLQFYAGFNFCLRKAYRVKKR